MRMAIIRGRVSALPSSAETPVKSTREGVENSAYVLVQCVLTTAANLQVTSVVIAFLGMAVVKLEKSAQVRKL